MNTITLQRDTGVGGGGADPIEYTEPIIRAKEIWHTFYKMPKNNFFDAKKQTLILIETYVNETRFANQTRALAYWKQVLGAAETL